MFWISFYSKRFFLFILGQNNKKLKQINQNLIYSICKSTFDTYLKGRWYFI